MAAFKRNHDKYTDAKQATINIVTRLQAGNCFSSRNSVNKSALGYCAFPDYSFKSPQGAAFSVAKIVRQMLEAKVLFEYDGYFLASNYRKALETMGIELPTQSTPITE